MARIGNAILYLGQFSTKSEVIRVKNLVDQYQGIINTMLGQATPKLLLVDYDPARTKITDVIRFLNARGIVAKAIGL